MVMWAQKVGSIEGRLQVMKRMHHPFIQILKKSRAMLKKARESLAELEVGAVQVRGCSKGLLPP